MSCLLLDGRVESLAMMPPEHSFLQEPERVQVAAGARAVEGRLLRDVDSLLRHAGQARELLAHPVRLVVPSQSLRLHVGAALVRHLGRSVAGVSVQTLYGLAMEIIDRAGEPIHRGEALVPILVRQQARQAAVLRAALDDLVDGYAAVGATVADLLDAGFTDIHAEVLDELLAQHAGAPAAVSRARALVRVSARVAAALTRHGLGRSSTLLQRAREIVERDGLAALPARAVLIHGFADATGVATDLIETVLRHCGGRVYVDHPPDPAMPARVDMGIAFTRRFVERFGAANTAAAGTVAAPQLHMISAPGADAEVRAVAQHIRNAIDQGVRPESIAVVARDLGAYVIPLRVQLHRLGIPFSALAARGPISAGGRRLHALLDLLARQEDATTDRWLDVLELSRLTGTPVAVATSLAADLRLGLRACGAARVRDVATLDVAALLAGRRALPLPVRHGLSAVEEDESGAALPVAPRRALRADMLGQAVEAACAVVARWAAWPAATDLRAHVAQLRDMLTTDLAWSPTAPAPATEVFAALETLDRGVSPGVVPEVILSTDDFALLLRNACTDIGTPPLGGEGGGVQVLNVMEARARTWEHLFVVGLNRDVFPRTVREDPLLPDALRRALASVLPDTPIKQIGFDEERYLFAQLLSASPQVTLSWQTVDDDGKPHAASPLIERLRLARPDIPVQAAPALYAPPSDHSELRTPHEHALLAGLYGVRTSLPDIWRVAIAHTQHTADLRALANARIAVLTEQDPSRRGAPHLGPYFGFIGTPREPADPRRSPLYVTTLERIAGCPWQTFVQRLLAIEPPPDPLAALPTIDALLIGSTVHRVLERIVGDAVATGPQPHLAAVMTRSPVQVVWPDTMRLQHLLHAAAADVLREAGIGLAGLAAVLAKQAQPYLEEAHRLDWAADGVSALGAEVEGALMVRDDGGREREVRFRADRVDAIDGAVRLTDYKTGKPVSQAKTAKTRQAHFLRDVESGKRLQAVAYVLGARAAGAVDAEGRYLFLTPDLDDAVRRVGIRAADGAATAAFDRTARTVLQAWDTGSFFPRLTEASTDVEPRRCAFCEVASACLRRDSGARARLRQWAAGARAAGTTGAGGSAAERALLALWYIGHDTDTVSEEADA